MKQIDIQKWMTYFKARVLGAFKERVVFIGLQGSYGRGEQTPTSDIDVVVIFDRAEFSDFQLYRAVLDQMQFRHLVCGFVAGMPQLLAWEKYDLLQLYLDAVPYFGSLDFLKECFTQEDVKRAVRIGACNVFHAALHNFLHARDRSAIKDIYKAARFVVRLKHYRDTGVYVPAMKELIKVADAEDNCILAICGQPFAGNDENEFTQKSKTLIEWAGNIIKNAA